jgi:hypothetical protein
MIVQASPNTNGERIRGPSASRSTFARLAHSRGDGVARSNVDPLRLAATVRDMV